jgi:hypothetical protein
MSADVEYTTFSDAGDAAEELLSDSAPKPDTSMLEEGKKRSKRAERYEDKVKEFVQAGFAITVRKPETRADAAALVMYGPALCEKWGDLADADPRVRKGIDYLTEGTQNPYLAVAATTIPFIIQLLRNHEQDLEVKQRGLRIPFTQKRFGFKFGLKMKFLSAVPGTSKPEFLEQHVFNDPDVIEKLEKLGIKAQRVS